MHVNVFRAPAARGILFDASTGWDINGSEI